MQDAALQLGVLTSEEFDNLVVPEKMIGPSDWTAWLVQSVDWFAELEKAKRPGVRFFWQNFNPVGLGVNELYNIICRFLGNTILGNCSIDSRLKQLGKVNKAVNTQFVIKGKPARQFQCMNKHHHLFCHSIFSSVNGGCTGSRFTLQVRPQAYKLRLVITKAASLVSSHCLVP